MPWIVQIEKEKILWESFKEGNLDIVKEEVKLLEKSKYKTSANIVVKILKKILNIKEK